MGNAVSNGVVILWIGIDWVRQIVDQIVAKALTLGVDFFSKLVIALLLFAYGIIIVVEGVRGRALTRFIGRIREVTYVILMLTPIFYGAVQFSFKVLFSMILFFPVFYGVVELIDKITPNPKTYEEEESYTKELKEKEEIPVQLQVEYVDNNGNKRMRVINDKVKVTQDENEFKTHYDQKFNAIMNIQAAGGGYYAGKGSQSKAHLTQLKGEMLKELKRLKSVSKNFDDKDFTEGVSYLEDELEEIEMEESEVAQAPPKSYWAAKGQQRTRMSTTSLKKRMKEKKK